MIIFFKSDAAEAEGGDDGASDATDPRAASDDLCTLPPLPLSKLSLSKDDDPEDLSLLQYFRVKCYANFIICLHCVLFILQIINLQMPKMMKKTVVF